MNELRCAWCGKKLAISASGSHSIFCQSHCQRQYEGWCRNRAMVRTEAVERWRDTARNRDVMQDMHFANFDLPLGRTGSVAKH